jgi:hypothetical protein
MSLSCLACPFRKSYPDVLVVQPGQDWDSDNDIRPLDRPTQGRILAQRQVRARVIVIRCIRSKNAAGAAAQSKTRWRAPQGDAELMTEKQVLRLKPAPRLEQIGDKHSDRVQDRKHRPE